MLVLCHCATDSIKLHLKHAYLHLPMPASMTRIREVSAQTGVAGGMLAALLLQTEGEEVNGVPLITVDMTTALTASVTLAWPTVSFLR